MNKPIKVLLSKVYISDKNKDGVPFVDRNNKPYKKVAIQTNIHGTKWLSALSFKEDDAMRELVEGQSVEIVVEEVGNYLNFKLPSRMDLLEAVVGNLQERVEILEGGNIDQRVPPMEADISKSEADLPF